MNPTIYSMPLHRILLSWQGMGRAGFFGSPLPRDSTPSTELVYKPIPDISIGFTCPSTTIRSGRRVPASRSRYRSHSIATLATNTRIYGERTKCLTPDTGLLSQSESIGPCRPIASLIPHPRVQVPQTHARDQQTTVCSGMSPPSPPKTFPVLSTGGALPSARNSCQDSTGRTSHSCTALNPICGRASPSARYSLPTSGSAMIPAARPEGEHAHGGPLATHAA